MSGIKRKIEDKDPDYEDISQVPESKRNKVVEQNAREATVQKIEAIIRDQFTLEMKNKEHEIEVIGQRLNEARRMMDKLRACIVANYYASAGQPKVQEQASKSDTSVLNHPAIKRFLESPSRSSSPLNQGSETPSLVPSETESLSQHGESIERDKDAGWREERRPGRNTGKDTFGVPPSAEVEQHVTYHSTGEEASRLFVKKTIIVGNVSKYIAPDKREENDQSTHKWMVYVRGSKKEPSIDHFVRKVWFFLHPSYKPNDLVEVSEPPFHLTRRGWGEFPVRVQIHFKDPRNKRIDIIHHLKLDRTYTGLQTLGAETVSLPIKSESVRSTCSERTPSRPKVTDKITLGSHGNSAFQPITASCKIVPQGQVPSPTESPGKSFQPITMSCKIVSGSPISTPRHSPLPRTPTSTPVQLKQGSSVINNPYIIVDKPGQVVGMTSASTTAGSPTAKQTGATQGVRSPAPKVHTGSFLSSGVKVIIKQEPGEVPTQPPPQQPPMVSTATTQQSAAQQFVAVKGGHMIAMSPQKQAGGSAGVGASSSKVLGIPVGSALQSAVKQVAISSGQILVAKSSPAVSKVMGQKQVVAQGVAKAIVSGASGASGGVGQQTLTLHSPFISVTIMATLQLPANNLANLANLPPGTKLYLTTNSKNPSGKGKLLLIPQGAILRASSSNSSIGGPGSGLPSNLGYTSYILKQTPQVYTHLTQPPSFLHSPSVVGGSQASQVKLSDGSVKAVTASGTHLSKPGTTTLRMAGGVITATSTTPTTPMVTTTATSQQTTDSATTPSLKASSTGVKLVSQNPVLVAANQAAVISAARSASSTATNTGGVAKSSVCTTVTMAKTVSSMLKLQSGQSSSQQTGLTIPTNQLKQLSVGTGAGSVQTILMPVGKGTPIYQEQYIMCILLSQFLLDKTLFKHTLILVLCSFLFLLSCHWCSTDHMENLSQLLTAALKRFPLIIPEKTEDSHTFCATSVEQYYSWNIGKRRAAELQRAVAVKHLLQEVLEKSPRLQGIMPPKTREVVQWCRQRGYTPPDPEPRQPEDSIEDILTQIDSEPECPSTLHDSEELCQRLERLQRLLKAEPEEEDNEPLDILSLFDPVSRTKAKQEPDEDHQDPRYYLGHSSSEQFIRDTSQEISVTFQPVEVEKNVFAPVVEAMILKATEQFASEILREALASGYMKSPQNRVSREISAMNIHQAVSNIPACDFLTNRYMGFLLKENGHTD
uniref:YEATS domain-containing protein 2 n=1 Tax=Denticeps clupeoides TaxID=299321 RepID=A0AAY4API1_9TELE